MMAVDIETIGIGVNTKEVKAATKDLDNFGKGADKASREADKLSKESEKLSKSASTVKGSFSALQSVLPILGFTALAAATIRASDSYTKFNAQLKIATSSQQEYNQAQKNVVEIANRAQASIGAIGTTYARLSNALKEIGGTQDQVSQITETLSLALKVNGATAEEASSAMLQLSQAFGKGKLDGDEFRTAMEAAPNVMRALAQSMGVPFGALKDLAGQGQITSDVLLKAFTDQKLLDGLRAQAEETRTISGAWQEVKNSIELAIGKLVEYIGLRDKINKNADLFLQALSPGGLLGGDTDYQRTNKLRQREAELKKELRFAEITLANRGNAPMIRDKLRKVQQELLSLAPDSRQLTPSAALADYSLAPNFTVNRTDESYKAQKRYEEDLAKKLQKDKEAAQQAIEDKKQKETQFYNYKSRLQDELKNKEDEITTAVYKTVGKLEKEEYEQKKKYMELLQKQANANFDEAQAKTKELADETKRISDELGRSLTDALFRGFESGKSFAQNFKDTLINTFRTLILRPIVSFIVDSSGISKAMAAFGSIFSGNAAAGGSSSGFGDLGSIFSSVKNIFTNGLESANIAFEQSIQEFGTFITKFGSFGESIGGAISQYSGAISNVLPYAGAFMKLLQGDFKGAAITATTTAIGSIFGPVGAGIGAVVGSLLGGMFGGGLPPRVTQSRTGIFSNGQFSAYEATDSGRRKLGMSEPLDRLNETFARNLSSIFSAFGLESEISSNSLLTKKKNTRARFNATVNGEFLGQSELDFGKKGTFEQAFASLVERALGSYTVKAIQASDLPAGIKQFFDGLVKSEDVTATINTLVGMKNALLDLPPVFNAVRNAMNTDAYKTTLDQLKAQFQATQTFVDLFYSGTEKFDIFTNQLITQFDALNQTLPTSRDQYRALVESINVVDEATRDQFNGLIALAPAMNEYFNLLSQQADGINEVNQALADGLNQNLFSTFADYASARASVANGITATGFMGDLSVRRSQGDAELANAVKSLVAQQARTDLILAEIADATRRTREINERWNGDGLPETRVI